MMLANQEIKQQKVQPQLPEEGSRPSELRILKPEINLRVCEKNYNCVIFCPRNAISINAKAWPAINYGLCDGCLICLRECPTSAITEVRE